VPLLLLGVILFGAGIGNATSLPPLIAQAEFVKDDVGRVVALNLAIGQQTPPVASVLIIACSIAKADIWQVTKANIYFIMVLLAVLLMCTYIPSIPMLLVNAFYR